MTKRSILAVVLGLWMVWTAAGCGRSGFLSDGAPDLPSLSRVMSDSGMRAALEKLGYKPLTVDASDDEVEMTVRRIGDHRTPFLDAEIAEIRQTAYDLVGYRFPLAVTGWVLGEKPQMTGRVTAVDGNRVLVVDEAKKLGEAQQPDAMWYAFDRSGDNRIRMKKTGIGLTVGRIQVGYTVEAWGDFAALSSYPGQTAGLELHILSTDVGEPDLRGTIQEIHLASEKDSDESYLVVDGKRVNVLRFTQYIESDHLILGDTWKKGDRVEIWDIGYPVDSNGIAATRIERIS